MQCALIPLAVFFPPLLAELANPWLRQGISTQTRAVTCAKDVGLKKLRA